MKYLDFSKYSFFISAVLLVVAFGVGLDKTVGITSAIALLLGTGFFLIQGKYRLGYVYSGALFVTGLCQYLFHLPMVYSISAVSVGLIFVILQTIEFLFKDKPLINTNC